MKTETKVLAGIFIATFLILGLAVFVLSKSTTPDNSINPDQTFQIDYSKGHKIGSDSARLKLVEYADYQCPYCKMADPFVKQVLQNHPTDVEFFFKNFPLPLHKNAVAAANAAEEAGAEGKYWQMHDKLYETQDSWSGYNDPTGFFASLGQGLGLDENKIKQAISSNLYKDIINQDLAEGNKLQITGTPSFFLNGRKLNLQNYTDLETEVNKSLNSK